MKFTRSQIEIFKKARSIIALGQEKYICFAIEHAGNILGTVKPAQQLKRHIQQLIQPDSRYGYMSLETWLIQRYKVPSEQLTQPAMREYRLRWMDVLLEECS